LANQSRHATRQTNQGKPLGNKSNQTTWQTNPGKLLANQSRQAACKPVKASHFCKQIKARGCVNQQQGAYWAYQPWPATWQSNQGKPVLVPEASGVIFLK
jgi:hypothetical protein